jgi:hypothetical protein
VLRTYLTYNTCSIIVFAACILVPKKVFSKIIVSLVAYGLKKNVRLLQLRSLTECSPTT